MLNGCPHTTYLPALHCNHACAYASCGPDKPSPLNAEKAHGLKYQAVCLPVGLGVLWGPWLGTEADATLQYASDLERVLQRMTRRYKRLRPGAKPLLLYGDNAYAETRHIVRATQWATSSRLERKLNDVFKPLRVVVEQLFACCTQLAPLVQSSNPSLQLGRSPVGQLYTVCLLFTNAHTMLYGNCIVASVPQALDALKNISLEAYFDV